MGTVFTFRMPAGIPGQVTREQHSTVEPQVMLSTNPITAYGLPAVLDSTTTQMRPAGAGDTAALVYGFLVRSFPTTDRTTVTQGTGNYAFGGGTPPSSGVCNILTRGYINVQLGGTTAAAKGGTVYVRIANASGGKPIGGVEAASDTTNTVALPAHTYFMGPADSTGVTEIAYNV